jgi:pimeloyl-ACP methyl ester carboxylesterase
MANREATRSCGVGTRNNVTIETHFRTVDGLSIRFAESESQADDALLLCPWPESLFAFDRMWGRLAEQAHLVAIDLPGFGHSERRNALLSPRAMGQFVVRAADAFGLKEPHVVGPDIGTGALLFAAALQPGHFRSLVVGGGAAAYPLQLGSPLTEWVAAPDVEELKKVDPRQLVAGALSAMERYELPPDVREDYLSAYEGDRFLESMRFIRAYPADLALLRDLLPQVETPVQIIAGENDSAVPRPNAEFLHERIQNSKLDFIDAGHFVWEDAADEYASLVASWWNGGFTTVDSARSR